METITLSGCAYYMHGEEFDSSLVGNGWDVNLYKPIPRPARYQFTAPSDGARSVKVTFPACYLQEGDHVPINFFIGTDPNSHADADRTYDFTGSLERQSGTSGMVGTAEITLLPNAVYYLWVFPADATYGWYNWELNDGKATLELDGAAGLAHIGNLNALPYIRINGTYKLAIPYERVNGEWKVCS